MLGRIATVGITAFWLIMMTLLVQREIMPAYEAAREEANTPGYARIKELAEKGYSEQMGIYLGERRIGFTRASIRDLPEEDAVRMDNTTQIRLNVPVGGLIPGAPGGGLDLKLNFTANVGEAGLQTFRLDVFSEGGSAPLAILDGQQIGDVLRVKVHQGEETRTEQVPFRSTSLLGNDMGPMVLPAKLEPGVKWPMRSLDPTTYTVRTAWATVKARETITVEGRDIAAYLITIPYGTSEFKVWATKDGEVIKQKFFGFTFVRESPDVPEATEDGDDRN
jgi:hypothetical protein